MRGAAWLIVLGACFTPDPSAGAPCGAGDACPSGLVCSAATHTCETANDESCPQGYLRQGGDCVDVDECAGANDCHADATCTNQPGAYSCACEPGFAGDGRACARVCNSVLVFDDCERANTKCASMPDTEFADNAAMTLGIQPTVVLADEPALTTQIADGAFDVLVIDASLGNIDQATADAIAGWINADGKTIVAFWDLDNATQGATLAAALQVTTTANTFTTPREVVPDPMSPTNLLAQVPVPLTFADVFIDDGEELSTTSGFIAARHTDVMGPGALAVTRNGRAITLGFLPVGMIYQGVRDADADGIPDAQELYTNLLGYLCGY